MANGGWKVRPLFCMQIASGMSNCFLMGKRFWQGYADCRQEQKSFKPFFLQADQRIFFLWILRMFGYLFLELILPILRIALQGNQNYADSRRKDVSLFRFFARTLTLQFNFPNTKFLLSASAEDPRGRKAWLRAEIPKKLPLVYFFS